MKVYLYKKEHWDYTETLGVYSEAGMLREKQRLLEEAGKQRAEEMLKREIEINQIKQERRELSIKDQNVNVPILQALKASGDRDALKTFKKERKALSREIERKTNQIWHLEFENHLLEKLEGDSLITHYFPKLYFDDVFSYELKKNPPSTNEIVKKNNITVSHQDTLKFLFLYFIRLFYCSKSYLKYTVLSYPAFTGRPSLS
jgi:hypothetical protein